ncbi:MAG TPA: serine hydrolase domain-containing protein [Rhodopila sp.]|uniref:serine hydrolase domain-containing protein n=1 Tax=Rhodopila sp. TaxID=2480087 RepID=UPI002C6ADB5E|nr:serine hydrolase domain-containing protein [Rhodopila sp.]HVY14523.1 serine hydrolase domain-containing protein [Rhodopila sp.]
MTAPLPTAKPEEVGLDPAALDRLSAALRDRVAAGHIPGAVALVARHGKVAYHEAFGAQDPAAGQPMARDSIFRIYSMTKPIVSIATMMLLEEGRFILADPIGKFIPAFNDTKVAVPDGSGGGEGYGLTAQVRPITVQDLLRHTSGLTYEFRGNGPIHKAYAQARVARLKQTNADQAAVLAALPLVHQPGTAWEYSRSTDVLGRLVEILSGESLGAFLARRILGPLGMEDSGFDVPADKHGRVAEPFAKDPESGADVALLDVKRPALFESGGGGMVGTAMDYARFLTMLHGHGRAGTTRLLGRKTVELMTADHLGSGITTRADLLPPGHGFGLGFAVRTHAGVAPFPGSVGNYFWSGAAGTFFWVDPVERLYAVLMCQAPGQREYYRSLFRDLVYAAVTD